MSTTPTRGSSQQIQASQITLSIWHPDCWTLQTTEQVDAGLIAHGVCQHDGIVAARLTAYADTTKDIDDLVAKIEASPLTRAVKVIEEYFNPTLRADAAGNATQELLVEYEPTNSIHDAFISRGFVPEEETRIYDGYEYWTVIVAASRSTIQQRLDEIREDMDADITVERMKCPESASAGGPPSNQLSERQREVFELAQREGYYTWPRECSASDLAGELGISKTTLLEHLRKAESKILGNID
ncbi:MAG: helix-turn-helix domain-containing protein [Halorhabdus sp.]